MKSTLSYIISALTLAVSLASCEKDNMPGPDAKVYGKIIDKTTGGLVETELVNGSRIEAFELGYPTQVSQVWVIKNNGEYRNNLVFSNKYDFQLRNSNFFPVSLLGYDIKPGDNQLDFQVTPYIRIKNCQITYDATTKKINASFSLEGGDATVKLAQLRLYAFSDIYVGENVKFNITGTSLQTFSSATIVPATTYTLSIDVGANAALFPTGRDYFFRVGALASVPNVGTIRHNFVPYVKITL